jgi:hypothetical protein
MIEGISAVMRHPLPVYPDKQTFSEPVGASHLCQQATFHFGRFAPQRRGVNFLQSLVSGVPLRFLTLAVAAPAHHHWCQFFIAAGW